VLILSFHTNSLFSDKVEWSNHTIQLKHPIVIDIEYTDYFLEGHTEEFDIFLAVSEIEELKVTLKKSFLLYGMFIQRNRMRSLLERQKK
jgi:hypothetical protein